MFCANCGKPVEGTWIKCPACNAATPHPAALNPGPARYTARHLVMFGGGTLVALAFVAGLGRNINRPPESAAPVKSESELLADEAVQAAQDTMTSAAQITQRQVTINRFKWSKSRAYCHAAGQLTNSGGAPLSSLKITAQFLSGGQLIDSDWSFSDLGLGTLEPGQSITWTHMFECQKRAEAAEISAVADQELVTVTNPNH